MDLGEGSGLIARVVPLDGQGHHHGGCNWLGLQLWMYYQGHCLLNGWNRPAIQLDMPIPRLDHIDPNGPRLQSSTGFGARLQACLCVCLLLKMTSQEPVNSCVHWTSRDGARLPCMTVRLPVCCYGCVGASSDVLWSQCLSLKQRWLRPPPEAMPV